MGEISFAFYLFRGAFSFKSKRKPSVLESARAPRLARITARANTNNETDKNEIVTNALREKKFSEVETDGFKTGARKACTS